MYFNDGTLQVNFTNDHVKVNISFLHSLAKMHVTFVNTVSFYYLQGFKRSNEPALMPSRVGALVYRT